MRESFASRRGCVRFRGYHMNKTWRGMSRAAPVLIAFALLLPPLKAAAEAVQLADVLSTDDAKCLSELLRHYYDYPGDHSADVAELSRSAKVGRATLSRHEPQAYIFLFHNIGWCGSAGCL